MKLTNHIKIDMTSSTFQLILQTSVIWATLSLTLSTGHIFLIFIINTMTRNGLCTTVKKYARLHLEEFKERISSSLI